MQRALTILFLFLILAVMFAVIRGIGPRTPEAPQTDFRGPTGAPYVEGPTGPPPGSE